MRRSFHEQDQGSNNRPTCLFKVRADVIDYYSIANIKWVLEISEVLELEISKARGMQMLTH